MFQHLVSTLTRSTQSIRCIASCVVVLILACTLSGCKWRLLDSQQRVDSAQELARTADLRWSLRKAGIFKIATATRRANHSGPIHVYIEGDGHAWASRSRLSADPTPRRATALELAVKDTHPSVVYIARPCQYLSAVDLDQCAPRYWSSHRFSEEVLAAINTMLDEIAGPAEREPRARLTLIGYSGGGTLAALLTAKRNDVDWLITIAANLDHQSWTTFHDVSPLLGSLSLEPQLRQLAAVRQCHLFGQRDTVVPPHLAQPILSRLVEMAGPDRVNWSTVENFDHGCCWAQIWPNALRECMTD
jgi:predicted esterase